MKKIGLELIEKEDDLIENEKTFKELKLDRLQYRIDEIKLEKVKDTSQEEIDAGNHINYPLKLNTGEIVNNKKEFLESKHWNSMKILYLKNHRKEYEEKRGGKITCEHCNKKYLRTDVQLHHLTYKNIGNENLEELQLICFKCHLKVHGKEEISKKEYKSNKDFKKGNIFNLETLILFGKYKEEKLSLKKLIEKDRNYVDWLINNNVIKINEKAKEYLMQMVNFKG